VNGRQRLTSIVAGMNSPRLSVVVPVHRVQPFLRGCLDSVLADAGDDLEIVAVDDASPDGCPVILDGYAATDPRVRVLHLTTNVGLGPARNVGLDAVRGEYVWFVDSDDWLPRGSVPAVLAALRDQRPDVLLLDHERVYDGGRVEPDASSRLLRGVTGAAPLTERPALLGLQHTAWNKVARVDTLHRLGLRFAPGWYEDFPFSHSLLIGAGSIGVLDRVCYHYRQRGTGAITGTVSDRHFEAFDQYERLAAELSRLGSVAEPFRADVFRLMVNHLLVIAGNAGRVPAARRGEFFHRVSGLYRRLRPAGGYPVPAGALGLKHRMVAADAYWAYATLRHAYRAKALLPRLPRRRRPMPVRVPAERPAVDSARVPVPHR
jgi:Glycosyl transferase family 2